MSFFLCGGLKDLVQPDKKHVLVYFPIPGRIAVVEMAFAMANVDYQRVSVAGKDWPGLKGSAPWGTMPVLKLPDGSQIGQSNAMQRYACKLAKLYPDDAMMAAKVDDFCDGVEGLSNKLMASYRMPQEQKEAFRLSWAISTFLPFVNHVTKMMGKNKYLLGDSMTMADLKMYAAACDVRSGRMDGIPTSVLNGCPAEFTQWMNNMGSDKAFAKLFETEQYKAYQPLKEKPMMGAPAKTELNPETQQIFDSVAPQVSEQLGVEAKDLKITNVTRQVVAGTNYVFDVEGSDGKKGQVKVFVPLPSFQPDGVGAEPKLVEAKWL